MVKSSVEILAETIGFEIGTSDDITQAKLLNAFCKGLNDSILQKSDLEMQLCYISNKLEPKTEKILLGLVEFIKLKNE